MVSQEHLLDLDRWVNGVYGRNKTEDWRLLSEALRELLSRREQERDIQSATAKRCAEIAEQSTPKASRDDGWVGDEYDSAQMARENAASRAAEAIRKEFRLSEITKGRE